MTSDRSEKLVRINAVGSGLEAADLAETIMGRPDGIVLPKVDRAGSVRRAGSVLNGAAPFILAGRGA